ncbi:MAG: RND family efflux transporter MFP subunit [Candidatus Azotimanducaceae bacterium]|jgi:RND family efflux transporter MFP subunit
MYGRRVQSDAMPSKIILPIAIITLCSAIALWMFVQKDPPQTIDKTPPVMLVDVMRAQAATATITVTAQGSVTPRTQTTLISEVSGLITDVSPAFVAGGFFSKGDVLVRIDDRNYRAEVKRAQASVRAAETNVTREAGLADYAKQDWERAQPVLKSSKAASDLAMRKPQLAEAFAGLDFAKADLEKREGDLDRTVIRAPYDGLVREKRADVGQFVNGGTPLAITFAVDVAEVRLPLPDRQLPYLNLDERELTQGRGPRVTLSAELGGQAHIWQGQIVRTEGVFDERSRVLYLVAQIDDPYNQHSSKWPHPLRMGTFVQAAIEGEQLDNVIRLPRTALRRDNTIWTVAADDTLKPVIVEVARADEQSVLIRSGLKSGQLISLTVPENPLPGTPVRYQEPNDTTVGIDLGTD